MNPVLTIVLVLCAIAALPPETTRDVLATAAATLFEGAPFILAAAHASRVLDTLGRHLRGRSGTVALRVANGALPLLGCGCGGGPAARSLPAAVATAFAFGPWVALARFAGAAAFAWAVQRLGRRADHRAAGRHAGDRAADLHERASPPRVASPAADAAAAARAAPAAGLAELLPFAVLAGAVAHALPLLLGAVPAWPPAGAAAAGAALGIALGSCGLGAVGVAGALRAASPFAAVGFLCVAGIADVRAIAHARALSRIHARSDEFAHACRAHAAPHDGLAYALGSAACALAAWHGGASLVHPRFVVPLWLSAAVLALLAFRHRRAPLTPAALAAATMLSAAILGAPAPNYRATATTLADAFPGEPLTFTGVVTRNAGTTALVRFAITCCRADAAPVVVRLSRDVPQRTGTWLRADGTLEAHDGTLRLRIAHAQAIAAPSDPYVYR